jgi:2-haloacid dehalogenase
MYKAILFDFDDTLVNYRKTRLNACSKFHRLHLAGLERDSGGRERTVGEDEFTEALILENEGAWDRFLAGSLPAERVIGGSFLSALDRVGLGRFASGEYEGLFLDTFCTAGEYEPHALETVTALSTRFRIGIVTNGLPGIQKRRIAGAGFAGLCGAVSISGDLGVGKPDPAIFRHCLERLGVKPEEALFIGDSLELDGAGAAASGIEFRLYNPRRNKNLSPRNREIADLSELETLIG